MVSNCVIAHSDKSKPSMFMLINTKYRHITRPFEWLPMKFLLTSLFSYMFVCSVAVFQKTADERAGNV